MQIPRVKIFEENAGYSPVRTNARNRQGIIAPFSRGPANVMTFITGFNDVADRYGMDSSLGSIAFQTSWDQGGREFGIMRILGTEKSATGKVEFGGYATKANNLLLNLKFIGPPIQKSQRLLKADILTSGNYTGNRSGRYWFRVTDIDEDDFATIKFIFLPLGQEEYINWYPRNRDEDTIPLDPNFPDSLKDILLCQVNQLSGINKNILKVVGAQSRTFSDMCLGLGQENESCASATVEGWEVVVEAGQLRWIYRIDNSGDTYRLDHENSGYIGTLPIAVPGTTDNDYAHFSAITETKEGRDVEDLGQSITGFTGNILPDTVEPTGSMVLNLRTDGGAPIPVNNGMFLTFDTTASANPVALDVGDMWSVRVNSNTFQIPIYEDATPNQVLTAMEEALSGRNPLGSSLKRNSTDTGVTFGLREELAGALGNNYSYFFDLQEPDGDVVTDGSFFSGERYIQVPIKFASYIQPGATVNVIESGGVYGVVNVSNPFDAFGPDNTDRRIIKQETKVVSVEAPITGGGLAVIWLDTAITTDFDSVATFHFHNPTGLSMTNYTWYQAKFLQGGQDGPRRAERDFYSLNGTPLLKIVASSEGEWGNSLRIDLYPIDNTRMQLSITDLNKGNYDPPIKDESFIFSFADTDEDGFIEPLKESSLVDGIFLPKYANPNFNVNLLRKSPLRLAPPDNKIGDPSNPAHPERFGPQVMKMVSLEDGYDGPPLIEQDYIQAIDSVRQSPIHFLLTPGVYSNVVRAKIAGQANSAKELEGLRIGIINARPGLDPASARSETFGFDTDRTVMVAGWTTYNGVLGAERYAASPDSYLSGMLSSKPFFIAPHARTSAGAIAGISEADTDVFSSESQLQLYSDAKLEVIHLDPSLFAYYFLNGRNLSSNTQWDKIHYRRTFNILRMDLFGYLQQFKGEPNTTRILSRIQSGIDAYMATRVRNQQIRNFTPSQVFNEEPASGQILIRVSVIPQYAIDYIDLYLIRDDEGNVNSRPS